MQLKPDERVVVTRGGIERRGSGRTLIDYFTFGNLYQPCAVLAVPDIPPTPSAISSRTTAIATSAISSARMLVA